MSVTLAPVLAIAEANTFGAGPFYPCLRLWSGPNCYQFDGESNVREKALESARIDAACLNEVIARTLADMGYKEVPRANAKRA